MVSVVTAAILHPSDVEGTRWAISLLLLEWVSSTCYSCSWSGPVSGHLAQKHAKSSKIKLQVTHSVLLSYKIQQWGL